MSDIVERLRDACVIDPNYGKSVRLTLDYDDYMEAADEIIRLRNELHIAREWSARVMAGRERDVDEITRLLAEVERLRAALKSIADLPVGYADMKQDDLVIILANKARAAIGDTHE